MLLKGFYTRYNCFLISGLSGHNIFTADIISVWESSKVRFGHKGKSLLFGSKKYTRKCKRNIRGKWLCQAFLKFRFGKNITKIHTKQIRKHSASGFTDSVSKHNKPDTKDVQRYDNLLHKNIFHEKYLRTGLIQLLSVENITGCGVNNDRGMLSWEVSAPNTDGLLVKISPMKPDSCHDEHNKWFVCTWSEQANKKKRSNRNYQLLRCGVRRYRDCLNYLLRLLLLLSCSPELLWGDAVLPEEGVLAFVLLVFWAGLACGACLSGALAGWLLTAGCEGLLLPEETLGLVFCVALVLRCGADWLTLRAGAGLFCLAGAVVAAGLWLEDGVCRAGWLTVCLAGLAWLSTLCPLAGVLWGCVAGRLRWGTLFSMADGFCRGVWVPVTVPLWLGACLLSTLGCCLAALLLLFCVAVFWRFTLASRVTCCVLLAGLAAGEDLSSWLGELLAALIWFGDAVPCLPCADCNSLPCLASSDLFALPISGAVPYLPACLCANWTSPCVIICGWL